MVKNRVEVGNRTTAVRVAGDRKQSKATARQLTEGEQRSAVQSKTLRWSMDVLGDRTTRRRRGHAQCRPKGFRLRRRDDGPWRRAGLAKPQKMRRVETKREQEAEEGEAKRASEACKRNVTSGAWWAGVRGRPGGLVCLESEKERLGLAGQVARRTWRWEGRRRGARKKRKKSNDGLRKSR